MVSMVFLEAITAQNAMLFKVVRLRALQDTPTAFRATYAEESRLSDDEWSRRAAQWNSARSIAYLAVDSGEACGIAAGMRDANDATIAHLLSMWVAPSHRRSGVGTMLVDAVVAWAISQSTGVVKLTVTSNNTAAICFYQCLNFTMTGRTEPYRNDPTLFDCEMIRTL